MTTAEISASRRSSIIKETVIERNSQRRKSLSHKHDNETDHTENCLPKIELQNTDAPKPRTLSSAPMRKISLPQIESVRLNAVNGEQQQTRPSTAGRRISLPALPISKTITSQVLKIVSDEENVPNQTGFYEEVRKDGFENNKQQSEMNKVFNGTTFGDGGRNLFSNQTNSSRKQRRDSVNHATVYTPASKSRRRSMLMPEEKTNYASFNKSGWNNSVEDSIIEHEQKEIHDESVQHGNDEKFKHAVRVGGKAAMFTKLLMNELNARYYDAMLNDPDYNDKYEKNATPDITTDEESETAILNDFAERLSDRTHSPEPMLAEKELGSSDSGTSETEDDAANDDKQMSWDSSSQSSIRANEVPDEIKELITFDIFKKEEKPDDVLMELGIWKPEDFQEHGNEADDEGSESDWSIKTFEEHNNEEDNEEFRFPSTPPQPSIPEPPPKTPPHFIKLPVGDTPDILHSPTPTESESSSSYTVNASNFDEYESDVFCSRLQENLFFIPPSAQSDAGDSDMFYCVPVHKMHFESALELPTRKAQKNADAARRRLTVNDGDRKIQKRRKRKDLDEQFVAAFMKKNRVQDVTIVQYGGATKAFRLRMARAGKDPEEEDNRRNARIERRVRKRLERGYKKRKKITKENLVKLPNLSKWAKVMRWIGIQRARQSDNMNVVLENGWMENADLEKSLRFVEGSNKQRLKKKDSVGLNSFEDGENRNDDEKQGKINYDEKNEIKRDKSENGENSIVVEERHETKQKKKKKKLRKRPKQTPLANRLANRVPESEESFVIKKYWQINAAGRHNSSAEVDMEEDFSPRSSASIETDRSGSISYDSNESALPIETPPTSPERGRKRFPTPETEPEPEKEADDVEEDEKSNRQPSQLSKKRRNTTLLNWKLLRPNLKNKMRREHFNTQFADVTRILFSQLTLKAKEYAKLPPIRKKSRAFSIATFKSSKSKSRQSTRSSKYPED